MRGDLPVYQVRVCAVRSRSKSSGCVAEAGAIVVTRRKVKSNIGGCGEWLAIGQREGQAVGRVACHGTVSQAQAAAFYRCRCSLSLCSFLRYAARTHTLSATIEAQGCAGWTGEVAGADAGGGGQDAGKAKWSGCETPRRWLLLRSAGRRSRTMRVAGVEQYTE